MAVAVAGPHLSKGRLCSQGGLGGLLLAGGSGGVPLVQPRSAGQARAPGLTTAMVPCSWLAMRCGLCTGGRVSQGAAGCRPPPLLPETSRRSNGAQWSLPSRGPARDRRGRACLVEGSGLRVPRPHHIWGPRLREVGARGGFSHWRRPVPQLFCGRRSSGRWLGPPGRRAPRSCSARPPGLRCPHSLLSPWART